MPEKSDPASTDTRHLDRRTFMKTVAAAGATAAAVGDAVSAAGQSSASGDSSAQALREAGADVRVVRADVGVEADVVLGPDGIPVVLPRQVAGPAGSRIAPGRSPRAC